MDFVLNGSSLLTLKPSEFRAVLAADRQIYGMEGNKIVFGEISTGYLLKIIQIG